MGDHTPTPARAVESTSELRDIPVSDLLPHPDNPRLQLRTEVVDKLAAEMIRTGFGAEHALLVRPAGDCWQIVSGHHRVEAAIEAGFATVPCWVKDMDDDEAFMQLVLANTQGELSPLEVGMHVLAWPGQQVYYVERTGFSKQYISRLRKAAEVARVQSSGLVRLSDKSEHLHAISHAPRASWPALVDALVQQGWTVADTSYYVEQVCQFSIPKEHHFWLPPGEVVAQFLASREFSNKTVQRLISAADQTFNWIATNSHHPDRDHDEFRDWLAANKRAEAWQPRTVAGYLQRLIAQQFVVIGWHQGDWRDHIVGLDDGSISLLLTDPPYGQGYRSDYRLDRRSDHKHDPIALDDDDAPAELLEALEALLPKLTDDAHVLVFCGWATEPAFREVVTKAGLTLRGSLVWDKQATGMGDPDTTFAPAHERILHAVKGSPLLFTRAADVLRHNRCDSARHPTEKPTELLSELIQAATVEGQMVADPFGGVASTLTAARDTGRRWWGCEINETYWKLGEDRLS